jgi:hypothetical protein
MRDRPEEQTGWRMTNKSLSTAVFRPEITRSVSPRIFQILMALTRRCCISRYRVA